MLAGSGTAVGETSVTDEKSLSFPPIDGVAVGTEEEVAIAKPTAIRVEDAQRGLRRVAARDGDVDVERRVVWVIVRGVVNQHRIRIPSVGLRKPIDPYEEANGSGIGASGGPNSPRCPEDSPPACLWVNSTHGLAVFRGLIGTHYSGNAPNRGAKSP